MQNKSILITGCSSGIGYYAAKALKQRGYTVLATARKAQDVAKLQQEGFESFILDVSDANSVEAAWQIVLEKTQGKLYGLINNAGFGVFAATEDVTRDMLEQQFATNVFGLHDLTRRVLHLMRSQNEGRIINISSVLGLVAIPNLSAYVASKYAVEGLSDTLRLELIGSPIKVVTIEPGAIETHFHGNAEQCFNNNVDRQNSIHQQEYTKIHNKINRVKKKTSPQRVIDKIILALEKSNPKPKYYVTATTLAAAFIKRFFPIRLMDYILVRIR